MRGETNILADSLSRMPHSKEEPEVIATVHKSEISFEEKVAKAARRDPSYREDMLNYEERGYELRGDLLYNNN